MLLVQPKLTHLNTLSHEGKLVILASMVENGATRLCYTVKQDGFEDSALQSPNGSGWEAFKKVELPNDSVGDASVEAKEQEELTDKNGKYLLRSIYKSADLTADAPVQLVSHDGHVYIFRQSTRGTLLVDRFVLDGMTNTLTPKLEVRFKRSRQRYKPLKAMKINSGGQMESVDALDFRDMQNQPFTEPTSELCPEMLNNLEHGWFGVVVTPTNEQESYRWQIFAYNRNSKKVDLLTLRAGSERMFDVQDYWFRTVDPVTDQVSYDSIPGLIRRELELQDSSGKTLPINNGLAAIKYDVQREQQTQNGPQLVRDASKILLAVPTEQGVAALSFAIAADGRLAQIAKEAKTETLRSQEREMLLPLNLLDNIRPVGDSSPAPAGTIAGMSRSTEDDSADRVRVQVGDKDKAALKKLKNGDSIKLSNTTSYNGLYTVGTVTNGSFTIDVPFKFGEVGDWEKVEDEDTGLVFDGLLTSYEKSGDGKLTVNAVNHGLAAGDLVQVVGSTAYDGEYAILKHDEGSFTVQRLWVNGEAVNIKLESRKRRGLVFDGKKDWIEAPFSQPLNLSAAFTFEAWVKLGKADNQTLIATGPAPLNLSGAAIGGYQAALSVFNGHFTFALHPFGPGVRAIRLESPSPAPLNEWVHVACAFDGKTLQLLENGELKESLPAEKLLQRATTAHDELVKALREEKEKQEAAVALRAQVVEIVDAQPDHPVYYDAGKLVLRNGGKVLSAEAGDTLVLATSGEQLAQRWRVEADGDAFVIRNLATDRVLDESGKQSAWQQADSQRWNLEPTSNGFYTLRAKSRGMVLEEWQGRVNLGNVWPLDSQNSWNQQWAFAPLGESKVNRARAALTAIETKPPQKSAPVAINAKTLTLASRAKTTSAQGELGGLEEPLQGQLADARIWTIGRTPKEISDTMYLQLTGREAGLAGYWRLGGIAMAEDGSQAVFDFSVNANHGSGHGAPYAGGMTLGRTLRDGKTEAVKFCNNDLFAVREGASYVESFEFRTDKNVDPNNADGKEGKLFKPSLWGCSSRGSEAKQAFTPMQENYQFEALNEGWVRATCRFIVPEGVRLLRCFEVGDLRGEWGTLEIRRHALKLVSNTVTQSNAGESARLTALASPLPTMLPGDKEKLQARQQELTAQKPGLEARQKELNTNLAAVSNLEQTRKERDEKQAEVTRLQEEERTLKSRYEAEEGSPFNYWCKLVSKQSGKCIYVLNASKDNLAQLVQFEWHTSTANGDHGKWKFEEVEDGYYKLVSKQSGKCIYVLNASKDNLAQLVQFEWHTSTANGDHGKWKFEEVEDGYFKIVSKQSGKCIYVTAASKDNLASLVQHEWHTSTANGDHGKWKLESLGETSNTKITDAKQAWEAKKSELANAQVELDRLSQLLSEGEGKRSTWEQELAEVRSKLAALETELADVTRKLATMLHPAELLRQLDAAEHEEAPLVTRQKELERLIGDTANRSATEAKQRETQALVDRLRGEESVLKRQYEREEASPFNYWCKLVSKQSGKCIYVLNASKDNLAQLVQFEWHTSTANGDHGKWKFEEVEDGYYKLVSKQSGKCIYVLNASKDNLAQLVQFEWHTSTANGDHGKWKFEEVEDGYFKIVSKQSGKCIYVTAASKDNLASLVQHEWHTSTANGDHGKWKLESLGETINTKITDAKQAWEAKKKDLDAAQAKLDELNKSLGATDDEKQLWQNELKDITERLKHLRVRISALHTAYLDTIAKANSTAQSMPDLPDQDDPRGLKVQGALLPFALSATRLHALESCTGHVSLSYQDRDGSLRQSHYDSAYDADGKGEEWIADKYRAALFFDGSKAALPLPASVLSGLSSQVTIEFWAKGGSQLPKACALIRAFGANNQPRLLIQLPNEKGEVIWEAGFRPDKGNIDRLARLVEAKLYRERWTHWAFVKDGDQGEMRIYVNGKLWDKNDPRAKDGKLNQSLAGITETALGGYPRQTPNWNGQLAELRIWNVALGEREIEANSVLTLSGNEPGLVAYYPFNEAQGDSARDQTGRGQHINIAGCTWTPCTAPIGRLLNPDESNLTAPMLVSAEYSRVRVDAQKRKAVMMLRCLALPTVEGVRLLDEQRIEELEMKWIGNAQINPTLVGYIEGAPPLPSENLTEEKDYNGATSVELIQSSDVEYSWTREQQKGGGVDMSAFVGIDVETEVTAATPFVSTSNKAYAMRAGLQTDVSFTKSYTNASTVGASSSLMSSDRLELRGSQEPEAHFPHLGQRFIPENIGYALVTSGLADVFVSKLKRSGRMVGYQVLPVEGVPLDVNTITFLVNPAYTMAGSLDGLTGSSATSDRFFRHVPEMRSQYGSLYPASYFRLKEAYNLKQQIENQDKQRESYFENFNVQWTGEAGYMDSDFKDQVNDTSRDTSASSLDSPDRAGGDRDEKLAELDQKLEPLQKQIKALEDKGDKRTPQETQELEQKREGYLSLKKDRDAREQAVAQERQKKGQERQDQIQNAYSSQSQQAHAASAFADWQRTMENLHVRAAKRNIVNTYVWDGDGGFHTEEQQFANTVEHCIGGSFDLSYAIGASMEGAVVGIGLGLSAMGRCNITQTMSKTARSSKGMELHVDLSGVESRGITDYRDYPILPGEKVDRYRFMSFFLENTTNHWHDFFNYVVDPEWLASNDEEARALRQTQSALPNKVWRVLHRVTYVERPALMGFGRSVTGRVAAADDIRELRDQLAELNGKVTALQKELNDKLDQLLTQKV